MLVGLIQVAPGELPVSYRSSAGGGSLKGMATPGEAQGPILGSLPLKSGCSRRAGECARISVVSIQRIQPRGSGTMGSKKKLAMTGLALFSGLASGLALTQPPPGPMSFFLTSVGSGNGGDLGGLEGADAICQNLAEAAGHGDRTWRAYLSTQGPNAVDARDRIGPGPWFNVNGARIAVNVDELHSSANRLAVFTALDELGRQIPGSGFAPNRHDILTGTRPDGTAYPAGDDMTCNNWTSSSDDGGAKARVGHHDYAAWNSTHDSRGCSQEALVSTGGDGLFYCFALPE